MSRLRGWLATQRRNWVANLRVVRQCRWAGFAGAAFLALSVVSSVYGALRAIGSTLRDQLEQLGYET